MAKLTPGQGGGAAGGVAGGCPGLPQEGRGHAPLDSQPGGTLPQAGWDTIANISLFQYQ